MLNFLRSALIFLIISLIVGFFPLTVGAAPYGAGSYQSGVYSALSPSPTPSVSAGSTTSNQVAGASTAAGSDWTCTDPPPATEPDLFQIDASLQTVKVYFSPAGSPYTRYFVSFGEGKSTEGHGSEFALSQSSGVLRYDVFHLKPNTVYSFKVRAGNGCKAGNWSRTMQIKTPPQNSKKTLKYYAYTNFAKQLFNRLVVR